MGGMTIARWLWRLRVAWRAALWRWGWGGAVALGLALLALGAWWWAHGQSAGLHGARLQARNAHAVVAPVVSAADDDDRVRLVAFDSVLVGQDAVPDVLRELLESADKLGLVLERGDYRLAADEAGRFVRFRMSMPVTGDVGRIRRFVQTNLQRHRALALESIRISRDAIEATEVQSQVQWSLLLRPKGVAAPEPVQAAIDRAVVPMGNMR